MLSENFGERMRHQINEAYENKLEEHVTWARLDRLQ